MNKSVAVTSFDWDGFLEETAKNLENLIDDARLVVKLVDGQVIFFEDGWKSADLLEKLPRASSVAKSPPSRCCSRMKEKVDSYNKLSGEQKNLGFADVFTGETARVNGALENAGKINPGLHREHHAHAGVPEGAA